MPTLAQPIANRVLVDLLSFTSHVTFSRVSNMFDVREKVVLGMDLSKI